MEERNSEGARRRSSKIIKDESRDDKRGKKTEEELKKSKGSKN